MNQLTQTASLIASEISSVENRERKRTASAQRHFEHAIGGWKTSGVGHGYGNGYPLEVLEKWLLKMEC